MGYSSVISRTDAAPLIPEEVTREVFKNVVNQSVVMQLARKLPNGSRGQERLPVMSALATASFMTGDNSLIQTSEVNWTNKYIYYEGLGVIIPIPRRVLADSDYDIWGECRPTIEEAFGKAFDLAVFHGTNAPSSWPTNIVSGATTAGSTVSLAASTDIYDAVMGDSGTLALVEADGYMPTGHAATMSVRGKLRGLRTADGAPIFLTTMQDRTRYELDGAPVVFAANAGITAASALMISGDFRKLVWSVRQDAEYTLLTEGVIQDGSGAIVYNLAQQNMAALRCTFYLGWALPNPPTRLNESTQYPFAALLP